jgi:hypothetical protein
VIRIGAAGAGGASRQFKECSFPGGGLVLLQGQQKAGGESAVKGGQRLNAGGKEGSGMVRYSRGRNGWVKSECVYGWRRRGPLARGGKRSARASLPCATRAPTGIYVTCTNCPAAQYWIRRRERASAWRTQAGRATTSYIYTCRQKHWKQRVSLARVSVGQGEAPRFAIHVSCSHLARFLTNAAVHTTAEAMAPIQACRAAVREPQGGAGFLISVLARVGLPTTPRLCSNNAPKKHHDREQRVH